MNVPTPRALAVALASLAVVPAYAQESAKPSGASPPPDPKAATTTPASETKAPGILPLPDYSGDFWSRRYLTGDWGGARSSLASKGVQFDVNFTQVLQSVVDGGRDTGTRYDGTLDYNLMFDLQQMGVMPGALIKVRAETRYGESVNGMAGPILPVNTDGFFPLSDGLDKDIPFTITNLTYIQYLSEKFGLLLGKFDTLDGDPNEFASGRGTSQFLNANFIFNASLAMTTPYSTLGGGALWMPVKGVTVSSLIYSTTDSSTSSGFENLGDGASWDTEAQFQYRLSDLPGGQNVGFCYSFDNDFTQIGGRFVFQPGQGLTVPTTGKTWSAYWSGWQYLYVKDPSDAPIDLTNGTIDHQGIGLFARFGFADRNANPVEWSASGGLGGKGIIPSRDNDTFGLGYYYSRIQTTRISGIAGLDDHTQGLEAFYNLAMTPAAHLTFDVQVVDSVQTSIDDALILGMRLGLRF